MRTKKNSFPNMVSPMTSSPADRLSFSSFDNMVSYRQHLRYFCRRKNFFFLQIIFSTKTFFFFTKLCMVCYTHTLEIRVRSNPSPPPQRELFENANICIFPTFQETAGSHIKPSLPVLVMATLNQFNSNFFCDFSKQ